MKKKKQIGIGLLGLWHMGNVYAAGLAEMGFKVWAYNMGGLTGVKEPGLDDLFKKHLGETILFSETPKEVIKNKKYVFLTADIPSDKNDKLVPDHVEEYFNLLIRYLSPGSTVVISSQVPVGTSAKFLANLRKKKKNVDVIYFPENLRLGNAIECFLHPDRIVVGSSSKQAIAEFKNDFKGFNCPILEMSLESAEMSKHALNSFLAMNISFSSEIGDLCELLGANLKDVVWALKTDKRVSDYAPINPGLGFAGGTLERDIKTLIRLASNSNYNLKLIKSIHSVNKSRLTYLEDKINKILGSVSNKKIGLLGLTYKPGIDTQRKSLSLELVRLLTRKKHEVRITDPAYDLFFKSKEFWKDLDLVVLMTEWPDFKSIVPAKIGRLVRTKNILDTKNFLNKESFQKAGFSFYMIGV